jgi:alkylation response protein AidB-like acyl-CoA dehydrogenase
VSTDRYDPVAFRAEFRGWLDANLPDEWRAPGYWYAMGEDESFTIRRAWERQKFDDGWAGVDWPVEYGGRGATSVERAIVEQELATAHAPTTVNTQIPILFPSLLLFGTDAQKHRFLRPLLRCDELWCQGFSEPDAGSDLASLRTSARRDGDDFVLSGQKVWTSFASMCDWCFALARTSSAARRQDGLTLFLVDMTAPGVETTAIRMANGRWEFAEVFFDDVRVPRDHALGPVDDGWSVIRGVLIEERSAWAAQAELFSYQFGLLAELLRIDAVDDPIAAQGADRLREFGRVAVDVELLQVHGREMLAALGAGTPVPAGDSSATKLFSSLTHQAMGALFAELAGSDWHLEPSTAPTGVEPGAGSRADGIRRELQQVYVRSLAETISGGTAQIQRNIIGERVLGLPRS